MSLRKDEINLPLERMRAQRGLLGNTQQVTETGSNQKKKTFYRPKNQKDYFQMSVSEGNGNDFDTDGEDLYNKNRVNEHLRNLNEL